jgi:hypothetical protein
VCSKPTENEKDILNEPIPEYLNGKKLIPNETFVLVGYSKTPKRFAWYEENKKYFFRMDDNKGSLELTQDVVNAKYLLLRRNGKETAADLYEIISKGPKVYSKDKIIKLNFPEQNDLKEYYLKIDIQKVKAAEFDNVSWDFKVLEEYQKVLETNHNRISKVGMPFTVSLTKLMKIKVRNFI